MQLTSMDQDLFNKFRGQDTSGLSANSERTRVCRRRFSRQW